MAGTKTLKPGDIQSITLRGSNPKEIAMQVTVGHGTANTSLANSDLSLSSITLDVILRRDGREKTLVSGSLKTLIGGLCFDSPRHYAIVDWTNAYCGCQTAVAAASGVKEVKVFPVILDLGGVINLKGDDALEVKLNFPSGAVSSSVDTSVTNIYLSTNDSTGFEYQTPCVTIAAINANEENFSVELGDNVFEIVAVNLDKTSVLDSAAVIRTLSIDSTEMKDTFSYRELTGNNIKMLPTGQEALNKRQTFKLPLVGADVDSCKINLTLNSSNVNASQNYIVARKFYSDINTLQRAKHSEGLHAERKLGKMGYRRG